MKKLSKKIVVNIILALVLIAIFATTAFAATSTVYLPYYTSGVGTAVVGSSSTVNCTSLAYNDLNSTGPLTCRLLGSSVSSLVDIDWWLSV